MGNMLRLGCLVLLVVAACSPVKDASNVPDAPVDSTDMRPPMIASSVPEDMATKVSVLAPISVFFDEALDPASVTAETVKLGYLPPNPPLVLPAFDVTAAHGPVPDGMIRIAGAVSYDEGAKKVSFVPAVPLPYGTSFTMSLDVKDHAGLSFTGTVHFTTYVNTVTREFRFDLNGLPSSWIGHQPDMAGWSASLIGGTQPGIDTIWFSADDPRDRHFGFSYAPEGTILDERYFAAGPDGRYDTPDDTISLCVKYIYGAEHTLNERTYSGTVGPDNVWCTNDDVPSNNSVFTYEGTKLTGFIINTDPGADNTWHTTDDTCFRYWDYEYDAQGNKTREIYRNCAADGFPHTADDTYVRYHQYQYDANGLPSSRAYHDDAGPDMQWLTADDGIGVFERYERDADGQLVAKLASFAPGPDAVWGTADDNNGFRTTYTYNAQKLVEEITAYSTSGSDGMWGTDDDVIGNYHHVTYDANGNRNDEKEYAIGADGMWRTADDRVSIDYDFELGK